jgi:hypothetical protein
LHQAKPVDVLICPPVALPQDETKGVRIISPQTKLDDFFWGEVYFLRPVYGVIRRKSGSVRENDILPTKLSKYAFPSHSTAEIGCKTTGNGERYGGFWGRCRRAVSAF